MRSLSRLSHVQEDLIFYSSSAAGQPESPTVRWTHRFVGAGSRLSTRHYFLGSSFFRYLLCSRLCAAFLCSLLCIIQRPGLRPPSLRPSIQCLDGCCLSHGCRRHTCVFPCHIGRTMRGKPTAEKKKQPIPDHIRRSILLCRTPQCALNGSCIVASLSSPAFVASSSSAAFAVVRLCHGFRIRHFSFRSSLQQSPLWSSLQALLARLTPQPQTRLKVKPPRHFSESTEGGARDQ